MSDPEKTYWLDAPGNVNKLVWGLVVVCGLLFAADLVVSGHPVFSWEGWVGFFAIFGFLAGMTVVLGAKALREVIKRDEDYYDR